MSDTELYNKAMLSRDWDAVLDIEEQITDPALKRKVHSRAAYLYHRDEGRDLI